jgi:hypothetical protein
LEARSRRQGTTDVGRRGHSFAIRCRNPKAAATARRMAACRVLLCTSVAEGMTWLTPAQHRRCSFRYRNCPPACRRQLRVPEQHFLKRSSAPPLSSPGDEARRLRPARRPAVVQAGGVSSSSLCENPRTRRRILPAWRNAALINGHQCFPAPGRL